jgi:hypothetical protein
MGWTVNAHAHGECYVIRVKPWNYEKWRFGYGVALEALQRLMESDHRWTLRVRQCLDDPWGPVLHEEIVATRSQVPGAIERVEALLRSGELRPQDQSG